MELEEGEEMAESRIEKLLEIALEIVGCYMYIHKVEEIDIDQGPGSRIVEQWVRMHFCTKKDMRERFEDTPNAQNAQNTPNAHTYFLKVDFAEIIFQQAILKLLELGTGQKFQQISHHDCRTVYIRQDFLDEYNQLSKKP